MATMSDLPVGSTVMVVFYGFGARVADCGSTGVVVRHNRTRVVVRLNTWGHQERAIAPGCLRVWKEG